MIENPKSLTEQLLNLVERVATEMKALFATVQTKQDKGDYATNTALASGLAGKANTTHGHAITDVSGLQSALDAKAPTGDYLTPTTADARYLSKTGKAISAGTADSAGTAGSATKATQDAQGNVINTTYATKTELTSGLGGKANTSHTHEQGQVTGLSEALAGKAAASHTHTTAQVTGLDSALAGKAAASHTHTKANITDFAHTHATSEVTGLDAALAGKADATALASKADASALAAKADTSAVISKSGNRGQLSGYELFSSVDTVMTINYASPDFMVADATDLLSLTFGFEDDLGAVQGEWGAIKVVVIQNASTLITFNAHTSLGPYTLVWEDGDVPSLEGKSTMRFVFHFIRSNVFASVKQW